MMVASNDMESAKDPKTKEKIGKQLDHISNEHKRVSNELEKILHTLSGENEESNEDTN